MKTTNTTTRRNPNLDRDIILEAAPAIMTRAHEMTRRLREREPALDYRATLAAALRELWAEYGKTAEEIWTGYTGDEQYNYLLKMAGYEYRMDGVRTNAKTGQPLLVFDWLRDSGLNVADELTGVAHSAWIGVTDFFQKNPDTDLPIGRIVSREITKAAARINRAEHRNARAIRTTTDDDGNERSVIDTKAGAAAARIDGPETAAILDDIMTRACRDDADRIVLHDAISGYKQSETAALLDIGQRAVSKRLDGIRDRMADALGRDPREKKAPRGKNARTA